MNWHDIELPRGGEYELFTTQGKTYCFDDLGAERITTPPDMFDWIRAQDPTQWRALQDGSDTAFYLKPNMYLAWKLKYGYGPDT